MGSCLAPPLPPPLYLYCGGRNLCDPGHNHVDHFLSLHSIQSGKKPPPPTGFGRFSHPNLLTPFPFRCFFSAFFYRCPFDPLSSATNFEETKMGRYLFSSKHLLEEKYPDIYFALFSRHRCGYFGDCTFGCPPFQPVLPHRILH